MSRPKEYIREKVLDDATRVFWQKGYSSSSLSELVAKTGLNKHSLYKEFGSKAGLFDECLENYTRKFMQELLKILQKRPLGLANIRAFFENRIDHICSKDFKCCLMVKSTVEKELIEKSALDRVRHQGQKFGKAIMDCIEAAVRSGELPRSTDPALLTSYLIHFLSGMMVVGKPEKGKEDAKKLLDLVMTAISTGS